MRRPRAWRYRYDGDPLGIDLGKQRIGCWVQLDTLYELVEVKGLSLVIDDGLVAMGDGGYASWLMTFLAAEIVCTMDGRMASWPVTLRWHHCWVDWLTHQCQYGWLLDDVADWQVS